MALVASACGGAGGKSPRPPEARSSLARDLDPQVAPADAAALVQGNTAFAADLLGQMPPGQNVMVSPYSVSIALAMTWAGARGETETEMAQALHFGLPQDRLHPAFDELDLALASRGQGAQGTGGKPFRLTISNAAWAQEGASFVPAYLDTLATSYGAGVFLLDFAGAPDVALSTINGWVAYETENRIQNLLSRIPPSTQLVLTDAVYFNAGWKNPFEHHATQDAPFQLSDGSQVNVSTMHGEVGGSYAEGDDWVAAELPYDGGDTSMVVVLPKSGSLETFEAGLDGAKLQAIGSALTPSQLLVSMPRFTFEFKAGLGNVLAQLGMGIAFSDLADFTGIEAAGGIAIGDVVHQTFVAVDEDGTEAAAATAVVVVGTAEPSGIDVTIDRPFLFFIRDVPTGTVLFLGRVVDPR